MATAGPINFKLFSFFFFFFFFFFIYKSPQWFLPNFKSIGLSFQKKGENRFSRRPPSLISACNNLSHCLFYHPPICFLLRLEAIRLSIQKWEIGLQDGHHGRYIGFPNGKILVIYLFYLQVTPLLPAKFQVNRPFGSREEMKNRFLRCGHLVR